MNYCAFDIEISKEIVSGQNWLDQLPLGISCLATQMTNGNVKPWYSSNPDDVIFFPSMIQETLEGLIHYLLNALENGYIPLTWNGAGFDFRVLAEETKMYDECKLLAKNSVDMMFHVLCLKGYAPGLNAVAHGLGLQGKTEGIHGDLAPIMWTANYQRLLECGREDLVQKSQRELQDLTIEYVGQDVISTLEVAETVDKLKYLKWVSKSGKMQYVYLPDGWMTVEQCLSIPEPDTSWMTNPRTRNDCVGWIFDG